MDFADIENAGKRLLASNPELRHAAKSAYHHLSYALSDKSVKCEGNVTRVSPADGYEYFFGYYDKSPWSSDEKLLLCMKAVCTNKDVAPAEPLDILVLDCENGYEPRKIGTSRSWSVQQGAMAQWLGPDFNTRVIYNDFRDGHYRSVIVDVATLEERELPLPVYAVAESGAFALTLDFSRLHRLRPGYGYRNLPDATEGQLVPASPCIWKLDIETGDSTPLLSYTDFAAFEPRLEMEGAEHKVNHLMINPSGTRFMVLHRWFKGGEKYTRLITANIDGGELFNLSDDDFVSHCFWKSDDEIISFMRRNDSGGDHYYLFHDKAHEFHLLWPSLKTDGHCSYSPDRSLVVTDTYPNRKRLASVYLCQEDVEEPERIARVFAPFSYDFDTRCDLHPRWNRKGEKVCFDSVHEGKRGLYICKLDSEEKVNDSYSVLPKITFVITSFRNTGPMNQTYYLVRGLMNQGFRVSILSIFNEIEDDSVKGKFDSIGVQQICLGLSKWQSLLVGQRRVKAALDTLSPDIVHAVGMPPYEMALGYQAATPFTVIRNYCREDYPAKYGKAAGLVMAGRDVLLIKKQLKKGCPLAVCSESLSRIYREKEGISLLAIANGVDTEFYRPASSPFQRERVRKDLGIDNSCLVVVYSGQINDRKDQRFAIDSFLSADLGPEARLVLLGDGPLLPILRERYKDFETIIFAGKVNDVRDYLNAADLYYSTSKSEGMPNGVLEAMACGLPVVLSDIPQHREVVEGDGNRFYKTFRLGDAESAVEALSAFSRNLCFEMRNEARDWVVNKYSSDKMIENYARFYCEIAHKSIASQKK